MTVHLRLYRALLHLYPASYRREYGYELVAIFAARTESYSGLFGALVSMMLAFGDIVPNAIAAHFETDAALLVIGGRDDEAGFVLLE